MDSEDLLYLLYTSGTTAKPKGIMHTTGGYLTQVAFTHKYVFDLHPDTDVYWCAADIGWVTGHSYIVYGPLTNGATSVIYEGTPDTPGRDRLWDIAERYGVTILYTAPTAIRTFMKWGAQEPEKHDLSKLRLLGSVGEPINPEAWMWYHEHIGGGRCPIVDTWWQTETGAIMISPLPGATITQARLGHVPAARHRAPRWSTTAGNRVERGGGYLTLTRPWPSMLRGIYGDPERYRETYWAKFDGRYFAGDGCKLDDDGYLWLLGRVDDVMNVSGHRISTTEVETALVDHPAVAEAAVVGANDAVTGQAIMAYVIARGTHTPSDELGEEVRQHVAKKLGAIARPEDGDLHRRAAQDPLRQDHAPPAARRRRGPRRWATPPRSPTRPSSRRSSAGPPRRPRRIDASARPSTGAGATARSSRARPSCSTWTACCPTRPAASTSSSGRAATGRPSSRRPARTRSSTRSPGSSSCSTPTCAIVLLTARPISVQRQTLGWLERHDLRWDLLVMREWGDYGAVARLQAGRRPRAAPLRLRPAPRLRGRPPQRRHVPPRGRPLHLHPLRLLRVSALLQGRVDGLEERLLVHRLRPRRPCSRGRASCARGGGWRPRWP